MAHLFKRLSILGKTTATEAADVAATKAPEATAEAGTKEAARTMGAMVAEAADEARTTEATTAKAVAIGGWTTATRTTRICSFPRPHPFPSSSHRAGWPTATWKRRRASPWAGAEMGTPTGLPAGLGGPTAAGARGGAIAWTRLSSFSPMAATTEALQ